MNNSVKLNNVGSRPAWAINTGMRFLALIVCFGHSSAHANNDEPIVEWEKRQNADERLRAYGTDLLGDGIDPHTGAINFQHTDVELPGNTHLEVAIRRKLSQGEFYSRAEAVEFGDWQIDVPRIHVVHMDGDFTANRCSTDFDVSLPVHATASGAMTLNSQYSEGVILEAPGSGSIHLLEYTTLDPQWPIESSHVSTEGWWFKCIAASDGGEGFEAHAPNGDTYTLDRIIVRAAPSMGATAGTFQPRERTIIAATRVTDVHGNYVDYNYDSSERLTSIVANDGRTITLNYAGGGELITSVTANGRTWSYAYSTSTFSNPNWIANYTATSRQTLDSVTRPDLRSWTFDLDAMEARPGPGANCVQVDQALAVTHPTGVRGDFDLSERLHRQSYSALTTIGVACPSEPPGGGGPVDPPVDVTYFDTLAVLSKTLTGPGIPSYAWSFSYEQDWDGTPGPLNTLCMDSATDPATECTNWTRVTEPDGRHITYYHLWNGEQLGGKLLRQEIRQDNNAGALLETTDTEYLLEAAVGFTFARFGPSPVTLGTPARTAETTIKRSGDTFTTTNTYVTDRNAGNYSWGRPTKTERSTSLTTTKRIVDTTYENRTSYWVNGLVDTVSRNGTLFDDYAYDLQGRVTEHKRFGTTWRTFGYHTTGVQAGRVSHVTDALSHRTDLLNYKRGLPQELKRPDTVSLYRTVDDNGWIESSTNARDYTTGFQYNDVGWLTHVAPPTTNGAWANTVIGYVFNASGVQQTITKANFETTVQYDGMLRSTLETVKDTSLPLSISHTRTDYDSQGRPIFQSFPSSMASAPDGVDTEYDALGRPTRTAQNVVPFAVTTTEYLPGYRVRVTDPRSYVTATDWLAFGAPAPSGDAPPWARDLPIRIDAPLGADRVMTYDNVGNVLTETMGASETSYAYDARNRLSTVTDPDNYVWSTYYDADDLPIVTIDGAARKTHTVYDVLHQPTKVIRAWAGDNSGLGATLDCDLMRTATAANPSMLQQCYQEIDYTLTGQTDTAADANGNLTHYLYDAFDRRTHTYFPSKTTPGQVSTTDYEQITYNAVGHTVSKRARRGDVITYTPDALGRLIDRQVPGAPTHVANGRTVTHSYTHDAWGHIETATHDGETILTAYDAIGRVTSQSYAGGRVVGYAWDAANNLTRLTWPDGFVVDYVWDANNRVDKALDGARVLADVAYDALSRRDAVAYANGTNVIHTWSARGDLTDHDHSFVGASVGYDFTYNGVGQMLSKTLSDPSYGWVAPTTGTDAYQVNGLNQYTAIDGASPIHDGNGNLTTDHQGRSFSYDAENVLRSASGLAGGSATYRYHADGSRRQKSHGGTTTRFYYMGGLGYLDEGDTAFAADQEIAEYSGAGALLRRFVRLPGSIDEAFLMIDVSGGSPVETWAHTDRLGSVIATTDGTGAVKDNYRYSPYGRPGSEGPTGFPFRFTGQRLDAETGLYYYKARYYDPETGRFLQTDPIGYQDQMNLYAYVGNDPVNGIDPSGLCETETGSRLCSQTGGGSKTGGTSQTNGSTDRSAGLAEQINAAPWPANNDLGSLGNDSGSGLDFSDRTVIDQGHVNQMLGDLRSVDDVVADSANAVVFISSVAIGGVAVVELGGAFLATESGIAAIEATRQMAIHISISKKMLLFNAGRLHISLTGGEGLGYALANSANTSAYPAWLLARGAVVAAPPAITAIVD